MSLHKSGDSPSPLGTAADLIITTNGGNTPCNFSNSAIHGNLLERLNHRR